MLKKSCLLIFIIALHLSCLNVNAYTLLNFQEVWHRIQLNNPTLAAECWKVGTSAGKVQQTKLLPNPSMGMTVENVGANQNQDGQEVQSTLMVNQPILLGNKYNQRIKLKKSEYQVQQYAYSLAYVTLYAEAGQRYVDVLIAQHVCETLKESMRIAELTAKEIKKRNKAGKSSLLELNSAEIALGETKIRLQSAEAQLNIAQAELAALWGESETNIGMVQDIGLPHTLLPLDTLLNYVPQSPIMQHALAQTQSSYNQVLTNRSEVWPDLNVGVGLRHFQQSQDNALVAGVSMPLPIFDRNQGNVQSSLANYSEKLTSQKATCISVKKQIYILFQKASQTNFEMNLLHDQLIPKASSAFDLAKKGYIQGRFSYLDLLNAQQRLIDERYRYWQVHGVHDKTLIEIYAMLGLINN